MVATVARETGWSYHDIMFEIPLSVVHQICDSVLWHNGAELRWVDSGVDIDKILNAD